MFNLKKLTRGHFSSKKGQLFHSGGGGGHYSTLKIDPGHYIFYGRHYSFLHRLKYTSNIWFLYFNNLWMIKYLSYYWWSISAFYGNIEILGLEVPLKHKNWMSLSFSWWMNISLFFFTTSWPVLQKALSEPYITYEFLSERYLHLASLAIIFCISAFWNTDFSCNWLLECITSVVWYKAAKRKRVLL